MDLTNARVSWNETYRTAGNVIAERTEWGKVRRVYYNAGSRDGHAIAGTYVEVEKCCGDVVSILASHVMLVQRS